MGWRSFLISCLLLCSSCRWERWGANPFPRASFMLSFLVRCHGFVGLVLRRRSMNSFLMSVTIIWVSLYPDVLFSSFMFQCCFCFSYSSFGLMILTCMPPVSPSSPWLPRDVSGYYGNAGLTVVASANCRHHSRNKYQRVLSYWMTEPSSEPWPVLVLILSLVVIWFCLWPGCHLWPCWRLRHCFFVLFTLVMILSVFHSGNGKNRSTLLNHSVQMFLENHTCIICVYRSDDRV